MHMPYVKMSWNMSKDKFVKYIVLLYTLCSSIESTYGKINICIPTFLVYSQLLADS